MSLITVNNLSIGYESQKVASNISFKVEKGDYLCIVGENGSGKTTLMKAILKLNPELEGKIIFDDEIKRNEIGYLPQQTSIQKDFPATVKEIVLSGVLCLYLVHPFYTKEDKTIANENMKRVGIYGIKDKCFRELSGGQMQRVLLARALSATNKLIILDEPVSGLDPIVSQDLYRLIKSLNDSGITIIMISHDISSILDYASHILHIGNSIFFGTKEEYLKSEIGEMFIDKNKGDKEHDK